MKWLFEQYGFNHRTIASTDFTGDLAAQYDAIVLPDGISRGTIVSGLDPKRHDKELAWAYGVGDAGWKKLARLGARRRHARRDRIGRRHRPRAARSADRAGAAGRVRRPPRRRRLAAARLPAGDATTRDARGVLQSRPPERRAARARHRSRLGLLLPGLAAAERVQLRASGRVRHAGRVAGVLRIRSGLPPQARLRDPERGRLALSGRRARSSRAAGCSARICCAIRPTSSRSASATAMS